MCPKFTLTFSIITTFVELLSISPSFVNLLYYFLSAEHEPSEGKLLFMK